MGTATRAGLWRVCLTRPALGACAHGRYLAPAYHSRRVQPAPTLSLSSTPAAALPRGGAVAARPARLARPRQRRPRLACLGDLALDIVIRPDSELAAGTDVAGGIELRAGGSAANVARAFAALGGEAMLLSAVGADGMGRRLVAALRAEGVRVQAPAVRGSTARLAVLLDRTGERSFVADRGAADGLSASRVRGAWLARADALHLPAYSLLAEPLASAARAAIGHARRAERLVSVDLASHRPLLAAGRKAARELIAEVAADVLLANTSEARALVGGASEKLLELAPLVVIKEGAAGCRVLWLATGGEVLQLAVATGRLETADTTGAGDAFDAGFLYSLIEQSLSVERAQRRQLARPVDRTQALRRAQVLRRAAVAGHRSAAGWLRRPRPALAL